MNMMANRLRQRRWDLYNRPDSLLLSVRILEEDGRKEVWRLTAGFHKRSSGHCVRVMTYSVGKASVTWYTTAGKILLWSANIHMKVRGNEPSLE